MDTDASAQPATDGDPMSPGGVIDLWFGAVVWCGEVRVGTVRGFVCSTMSPHLHSVIVRDDERGHTEHPVAVADIGESTDHRDVAVTLPAEQVRAQRCPTETVIVDEPDEMRWIDLEYGPYDGWTPHVEPLHIPVTVPKLDPGDTQVRTHAVVSVAQHHVGRLSGLQVDRASRRITGCIVDVGHRWRHRHVLVPASAIERLSETIVSLRGDRREIMHLPAPADQHDHAADDLEPMQPDALGVDDREPDTAHTEAAHLIADQARATLRARGFTDAEIRHWADAYLRTEHSGDTDRFLAWIDTREHGR